MNYLAPLAFVAIIGSLGAALYFMMRGGGKSPDPNTPSASNRMVRALAVRVGLSIVLFICILIGWKLGYLHPTGIPAGK